ncbi:MULTISPECIES: hypothetical protein [unclassified Streptomyces]|uniref:hypothetical protein n=1 Tax=Streptomyces sp. NPDC055082 TaxID=3365718 RepID=UPI0037D18BFF
MTLSVSLFLLTGIVVVVLIRSGVLKPGPAVASALFGFFLASTSMAPEVTRFASGVTGLIGNIKF